MSLEGIDPSLLQDFLTESSELIERLDADLVALEGAAAGDASELLNGIFRALHTIKGAASFLALTEVTTFAHAAEDALNKLRKGEAPVTTEVMDALLRSTDVLRQQIEDMNAGSAAGAAPAELLEALHAIAEGGPGPAEAPSQAQTADSAGPAGPASATDTTSRAAASPVSAPCALRPLDLPAQKLDLIEFMAADLRDSCHEIVAAIAKARDAEHRHDAADELHRIGDCLEKTTDFFELSGLARLVGYITRAADVLTNLSSPVLDELLIRLEAIRLLVEEQAAVIEQRQEMVWPLETLSARLQTLIEGHALPADIAGGHGNDVRRVLELDGAVSGSASAEDAMGGVGGQTPAAASPEPAAAPRPAAPSCAGPAASPLPPAAQTSAMEAGGRGGEPKRAVAEQTIRVEVGRLEALLNMVGQLVLNKNRFLALTRRINERAIPQDLREDMATAASDYDRITSELQMGVMRTRM